MSIFGQCEPLLSRSSGEFLLLSLSPPRMTIESRRRRPSCLQSQIEHWSTLERVTVVLESEQTRATTLTSMGKQVSH